MFKMIAQLWSALSVLCLAIETIASSMLNLAKVAEHHTENILEETKLESRKARHVLEQEVKAIEAS